MTGGEIAALLVSLVGAAGGLYAAFRRINSEVKLKEQATALSEAFEIVAELRRQIIDHQGQIDRQQQQIEAKQDAINRLFAMNADCEAAMDAAQGWMAWAQAWMARQDARLVAAGLPSEGSPAPPPRHERPRGDDSAGKLARDTQQNTGLSGALSRRGRRPGGEGEVAL